MPRTAAGSAKGIVARIARSWSRDKDNAQRGGLEHEIQYQLGCTYGRAASYANDIRVQWSKRNKREVQKCIDAAPAACRWVMGLD